MRIAAGKLLVLAVLVFAVWSQAAPAQQPQPPPPPAPTTPPIETAPPPLSAPVVAPPPVTQPPPPQAFPLQEPMSTGGGGHPRHSGFSAGPGGLTLMFLNGGAGLLLGALVGAAVAAENAGTDNARNNVAPLTALVGAIVGGGLAAAYQYAAWTNHPRAIGGLLTLIAGFFAGLGVTSDAGLWPFRSFRTSSSPIVGALVLAAITEIAFFTYLAVTHEAEMAWTDTLMMMVGSIWGFTVMGLIWGLVDSASDGRTLLPGTLVAYAPLGGLIAGGLLSMAAKPSARQILLAGLVPIGITAGFMSLLSTFVARPQGPATPYFWGAAIGVLALSEGLVLLFTSGATRPVTQADSRRLGFDVAPTLVLTPDVVNGRGVVSGLGLAGRF